MHMSNFFRLLVHNPEFRLLVYNFIMLTFQLINKYRITATVKKRFNRMSEMNYF